MHRVATILLITAGIIHLLPLPGVLGVSQLSRLYGVVIDDPNVALLMRHRAVLFGLLGTLMVAAAFRTQLRAVAYAAGLANAIAFVAMAWSVSNYNASIGRVVVADIVAIGCLLLAIGIDHRSSGT